MVRRRRRSGRSRRPPKQHGWDTEANAIDINVGGPTEPFCNFAILQEYFAGSSGILVNEPDPFYCERIMLDMFPFLGRFDESDLSTIRFWNWALVTADLDELGAFAQGTQQDTDLYDNNSDIWGDTARVLQQGVAPVYFSTLVSQDEMAGALAVDQTEGPSLTTSTIVAPFGPSAVRGVDVSTRFSLREGQVLALVVSCGDDPEWVTGDTLSVSFWYKSLWTKRRNG